MGWTQIKFPQTKEEIIEQFNCEQKTRKAGSSRCSTEEHEETAEAHANGQDLCAGEST